MKYRAVLVTSVLAVACTTNPPAPDASSDVDAGTDASAIPDTGPRPDAWPMPNFDTSTTWNATPLDCPAGPARRVPRNLGSQRLFALGILHYNVQYVAGGLTGALLGGRQPFPDWGDDRVQDSIVTESLVPVLALLDAHPTWTFSIEMQGYFAEILLARHRDVAQHLSDLVRAGQVELVSFHYSDQLFLAYPRGHMDRSHDLNTRVLGDACLAVSGPVFTQEGQFGEGMADLLGTSGDASLMLPKNLFSHLHGDVAVAPFYSTHGVPVVIAGRGVTDAASGFTSSWWYMDDAELLATNHVNPYTPPDFHVVPSAVAAYESQLMALEASGYVIAGVGDWIATLQGAGVAPVDLPPMVDGTWQPDDTENLARWMGNTGAFAATERDNRIVTTNSDAGRTALAAETALHAAVTAGHAMPDADLQRAWRDLFLGEVSDATGWNPANTEVYYGWFHGDAARTRARGVAIAAAASLGIAPPFYVDTQAGTVSATATVPALEDDPSPPFTIEVGAGRAATSSWQRVVGETDHHVLTIAIPPAGGMAQITIPWTLDHVRYTPALLDGASVDLPLSGFTFTTTAIPIDDGPFGLATDQWLILDTATIALAARLDVAAHTVTFRDASLPTSDGDTWVLHVVTGSVDRALAVADRLNLHPLVRIDAP